MKDDAILEKLGQRVREERAEEALPPGVAPFDDAMAERIAARILADEPAAPKADHRASAEVIRPSRFRWFAPAVLPLAAAAAVALWIRGRSNDTLLPDYEVAVVSAKTSRSDPGARSNDVVLDPNGDFELVARPTAPAKNVSARALLVHHGAAHPWSVPVEVSNEGSVRTAGTTKMLFPETRGRYEIVLLVAPSGSLPADADAKTIAEGAREAAPPVRTVRTRVRFAE